MIPQIKSTAQLLKSGEWQDLLDSGRAHLKSETTSFGLRRDLTLPFTAPDALIPITVRPVRPADIVTLLEAGAGDLSGEAQRERAIRKRMIESGLATCYVAVTEQDEPCFMQWLIGHQENPRIRELFGNRFPQLRPDEMLLEGAFTLEQWRGQKIMAAAMARIAEMGAAYGARWAITFVATDNVPSLKGCAKAGFTPYVERADRWRLFRHESTFDPLPETVRVFA
jgi:GNAT superfamily N-acetyltransferase